MTRPMGDVARALRVTPLSRRLCLLSRQRGARLTSLLELRDRPAAVISASSQPWAMAAAERYDRGSPGAHGAGAARQPGETVARSRSTCPGWGAILSSAALGPAGGQQEGSRRHSLWGGQRAARCDLPCCPDAATCRIPAGSPVALRGPQPQEDADLHGAPPPPQPHEYPRSRGKGAGGDFPGAPRSPRPDLHK